MESPPELDFCLIMELLNFKGYLDVIKTLVCHSISPGCRIHIGGRWYTVIMKIEPD